MHVDGFEDEGSHMERKKGGPLVAENTEDNRKQRNWDLSLTTMRK